MLMLTKKQTTLYWRTWAAVCAAQGWSNSDNERRYALHADARCPRSMRDFHNHDLDKFLAAAAPLTNTIDIRDRDRERLLWRIRADARAAGFADSYLERIARDIHGTGDWEALPIGPLTQFRNVIHQRARRRAPRARAPELVAEPF